MIQKIHFRFKVAKVLGTDIIQIPTLGRKDDGVAGDFDTVVCDMGEVADLGLEESPAIRFACRNLA